MTLPSLFVPQPPKLRTEAADVRGRLTDRPEAGRTVHVLATVRVWDGRDERKFRECSGCDRAWEFYFDEDMPTVCPVAAIEAELLQVRLCGERQQAQLDRLLARAARG